jgi:hypothetical protein
MTKKVDVPQAELLEELTKERDVLQKLRTKEDDSKERVWALVRRGFEMDVSGVKLSKASGLSQSRVYQIRDEAVAEAQEV